MSDKPASETPIVYHVIDRRTLIVGGQRFGTNEPVIDVIRHLERALQSAEQSLALERAARERAEADARILSWWIAMLAESYPSPGVGDWVVEKSHLVGVKRYKAHPAAIGRVKEALPNSCYVLELLDGTEQRWENALMCKLPAIDQALAQEGGKP